MIDDLRKRFEEKVNITDELWNDIANKTGSVASTKLNSKITSNYRFLTSQ